MIGNVNVQKLKVPNEVPFCKKDFKYFIGYKDDRRARPLCITLSKMSAYRGDFEGTKHMSCLIKDDKFLEKYCNIWDKVSNSVKKGFDSELVYNETYLKTSIKSYEEKSAHIFMTIRCQKKRFSMHLSISNIDWFCF